ncbi:hypothetical protein SUGI_0781480 [Cryptomeria japonica]|uniref:RING-H2 finger protein ATL74 n=1 Tax=Cryptomeria japonica TaxID=3369 RepID=UPI002414BCE6|nr:RING-H2 finger protein ATL74 [Cryptomeria japonica]GLJ38377.1 hypothetical protein SUGI_0781480 [Cryptomeria japonica]
MSIVVFLAVVTATLILSKAIYNYCCKARSAASRRRNGFDNSEDDISIVVPVGLDKESLNALPIVEYKPENPKAGLECAVCLSEFEENEKLRVLPSCNHGFHTECIDMWLHSHTSCPLCRTTVQPIMTSNGLKSVNGEEEFHTDNSLGDQPISSNIDLSNETVVHGHLVRGQRSCGRVQYLIPSILDLRATENEMDQGLHDGRLSPHITIEIEFY